MALSAFTMAGFSATITSFVTSKLEDALTYLVELDTAKHIQRVDGAGYWLAPWGLVKISETTTTTERPTEITGETRAAVTVNKSESTNIRNSSNSPNDTSVKISSLDNANVSGVPHDSGQRSIACLGKLVVHEKCLVGAKNPDPEQLPQDKLSDDGYRSPELIDSPEFHPGSPEYETVTIDSPGFHPSSPECQTVTIDSPGPHPCSPFLDDKAPELADPSVPTRATSEPAGRHVSNANGRTFHNDDGQQSGTFHLSHHTVEALGAYFEDEDDRLWYKLSKAEKQFDIAQRRVELLKGRVVGAEGQDEEAMARVENKLAKQEESIGALITKIYKDGERLKMVRSREILEIRERAMCLKRSHQKQVPMAPSSDYPPRDKSSSSSDDERLENQELIDQHPSHGEVPTPSDPKSTHREASIDKPVCLEDVHGEADADPLLSLEDLHREAVRHGLDYLGERLFKVQETFENRKTKYWESYEVFRKAFELGKTGGWTWEGWDLVQVNAVSWLTHDLIEAERRYNDNLLEAKKLGIYSTLQDWDTSSGFFDQEGPCGYDSEFEEATIKSAPTAVILIWRDQLEVAQARRYQQVWDRLPPCARERVRAQEAKAADVDDWDVDSLKCGQSVSDIDRIESHRKRIDDWREICEARRPERLDV